MINNELAISVIVPVYNLENYIEECLDSLMNQSFSNFEVILIDDASCDKTREVIGRYKKNKKIILLENQKNMGAGYSRNRGLDLAKGKYIIFLDGDDRFEYNLLETIYNACEKNEADIGIFNFFYLDNDTGRRIEHVSPIDMVIKSSGIFQLRDISVCAFQYLHEVAWDKIFRRDFIIKEGINFQCQNNANDQFFVWAALLKSKKIVKISNCLLNYRINRNDQLSTSTNISRYPLCIWKALKATVDYMDKIGVYDLYKESFNQYAIRRLIFSLKKVDVECRKELIKLYRENGYADLKLQKCDIHDFGIPYYYAMYKWLSVSESSEKLEDMEKRNIWNSSEKLERLFKKLSDKKNVILWGAGKNGEIFLEKAVEHKLNIKDVVDIDEKKWKTSVNGYIINSYEFITDNDLILTLNPDHISAIQYLMGKHKKTVLVLDIQAYICFDITYDQAIIAVSNKNVKE